MFYLVSFILAIEIFIQGTFFSGAAHYFHENGVTNFLVLEGNGYIGGRMKNKDFGGASVSLGPGWIHFPEENHILVQLALKYNLSTVLDTLPLREIIFRYT